MALRYDSGKSARKAPSTARGRAGSGRGKARSKAGGDRRLLFFLSLILVASLALFVYSYLQYRPRGQSGILGAKDLNPGADLSLPEGSFADGVRFRNVNLGGLDYQAAFELLKQSESNLVDGSGQITFKFAKEELKKNPYAMGLRLDIDAILRDGMNLAKNTSYSKKELSDPHFKLDETAFAAAMQELKAEIDQEGKDAECSGFDFDSKTFTFKKEQQGREFKIDENREKIADALRSANFSQPVELKVKLTEPGRSAEKMSEKLGFVASASTPIMYYNEARNRNVQLAADRIHGTVVLPHESFSYNKTIGPMTLENGFVEAGIQDADGNDALGIGGGLCQPSTTLYQAAVRSNMVINAHNFHSTPVGYCNIGTDAMVSDASDLVFTNPTDYPYAIVAYFDGATLSFAFYGPPNPDDAVIDLYVEELENKEVEGDPRIVEDASVPANETSVKVEPRPDRRVRVYRTFTVNGQLLRSELMYDHTYPGTTGVVAASDVEAIKASLSGESQPADGENGSTTSSAMQTVIVDESEYLTP